MRRPVFAFAAVFALAALLTPTQAGEPGAWGEDLPAALKEARMLNRPLLLDFRADWCGPCKKLEATTFRDPAFAQYLSANFVTVKVDHDRQQALVRRYNVEKLPTLLVLSPAGDELARRTGYETAAGLTRWLEPHKLTAASAPAASADPWAACHRDMVRALDRGR